MAKDNGSHFSAQAIAAQAVAVAVAKANFNGTHDYGISRWIPHE